MPFYNYSFLPIRRIANLEVYFGKKILSLFYSIIAGVIVGLQPLFIHKILTIRHLKLNFAPSNPINTGTFYRRLNFSLSATYFNFTKKR